MTRNSFVTDRSMVISIPTQGHQGAWPDTFQCRFLDSHKVLVHSGRPGSVGTAQVCCGVFLLVLVLVLGLRELIYWTYIIPAVLYMVTGFVSFATSRVPNMMVTKLSLFLNLVCVLLSVPLVCVRVSFLHSTDVSIGIQALILSVMILEALVSLFSIYWINKVVCKGHFNSLPVVLLKRGD